VVIEGKLQRLMGMPSDRESPAARPVVFHSLIDSNGTWIGFDSTDMKQQEKIL
jgi:hypothetical protein